MNEATDDYPERSSLDQRNSDFWETLCGTHLANILGITDRTAASLKKFDDWFLAFYPYVFQHIPFADMCGKRVLEVGLGYGTVSQLIAAAGANYVGLDIAQGPVEMVDHRILMHGLKGSAQVGNILHAPFEDESFDIVVSIGCFHHTGNMQRAIDETWRVLRSGGTLFLMVYNGYSYRRWVQAPGPTFRYLLADYLGLGRARTASADERAAYDTNTKGEAAPHTDFVSRRALRRMCSRFRTFAASLENIDQATPFAHRTREDLLKTAWPRLIGLDIYAQIGK
jgi:SAM-dependent methyltransferase